MTTEAENFTAPSEPLPEGAWDTHAHVFGPFDRFPVSKDAPYKAPLSTANTYIRMLNRVGFTNGVLIQGGAYGFDNAALLDALSFAEGRLRGVAVVPPNVSTSALERMHSAGVRGVRFVSLPQQFAKTSPGHLEVENLIHLAPRLRELGWHAQVWMPANDILEHAEMLRGAGVQIVFDHLGLQMDFETVARGPSDPAFSSLIELAAEGIAWIKTTAFRSSRRLPGMDDIRPLHDALLSAVPDRLIWGSDWPFLGLDAPLPSIPHLLDILREWSGPELYKAILTQNPTRLYGTPTTQTRI